MSANSNRIVVLPTDIFAVKDERMTIYVQMVYMVIRRYMNRKTNNCFPSYETIARDGRMSRSTAIKAVKVLIELELITKEVRTLDTPRDKKRNTSNLYIFPASSEKTSKPKSNQKPSASATPPSSPQQPTRPQKPSASDTPEQKDFYKQFITNKRNNTYVEKVPSFVLEQSSKDFKTECTTEQIQIANDLLDKLSRLAV